MNQYIYIDVYFGLNFLMDFVVLLITRMAIKNNRKMYRLTLASGVGALYAVVILIFNVSGMVSRIFTYFIVAGLMLLIAFGKTNLKNAIRNILTLYIVTFLVSGIINALYYGTNCGKNILEMANTDTYGKMSISFILCICIIIISLFWAVRDKMRKYIKTSKYIFQVSVNAGSKQLKVIALCDTGNSLFEPITGKPVSVIEESSIKSLEKEKLRYLMVPYNTVGKKNGIMKAFIADSVEIEGKTTTNTIIGIHEGRLSRDKRYEMILHPNIVDNKEK